MLKKIELDILSLLEKNSRISQKDIAEQIHSTPPTVSKIMSNLTERGLIAGFSTDIRHSYFGYNILAYVMIRCQSQKRSDQQKMINKAKNISEILEFNEIFGQEWDFIAKILTKDNKMLRDTLHYFVDDENVERIMTLNVSDTLKYSKGIPVSELKN
ncbi:MAG: Lrp/AsnC family transcriptional regulator [Pseudomonadota bacterium]